MRNRMSCRVLSLLMLLILLAQPIFAEENADAFTYPMDTDVTLTYWSLYAKAAATHNKYEETPYAMALAERTGVFVEYTFGTAEQFNIMVSSGETHDILEYPFVNYPGGPDKAIADKVILPLNDLQAYTPNLNKLLEDKPDYNKQVVTDIGNYYVFPFFRGDPSLQVYQGPILRQDWLDELGIAVPETVDECEAMLQAFKDQKGAAAPFSVLNGVGFLIRSVGSAYGLSENFFVDDDGEIQYGAYTENYKAFLAKLNDWYEKGLLDPSYGAVDQATLDANILNGNTGLTVHNSGGGFGRWMDTKKDDPSFQLGGMRPLVMNKGEAPFTGQMENVYPTTTSAAISTSCENPEIAARFLDYGYSEEGYMFNNFGIEGESYTMIDGYPTYTELILDNPEYGVSDMLNCYIRAVGGGQFVQDKRYFEQYIARESQRDAVDLWADTEASKHNLPVLYYSDAEARRLATLTADINLFVAEKTTKYIIGAESLDTFDAFLAELQDMGIEECIEICAAAYARYQVR